MHQLMKNIVNLTVTKWRGNMLFQSYLHQQQNRIDTENMKFLLASAVFVEAEINRLLMTNEME